MHYAAHSYEDQKKEIELSIARTIVTQVKNGNIEFATGQQIAQYTLEHIDTTKTGEDLVMFLGDLAKKWPIFATLHELFKVRMNETKHIEEQLATTHKAFAAEQ